jgi:hypothetical protein
MPTTRPQRRGRLVQHHVSPELGCGFVHHGADVQHRIRPIVDVLDAIDSELTQIAVSPIDDAPDPKQITIRLDDFQSGPKCSCLRPDIRTGNQ